MDRFEILKYSILLEEYIKKKITDKIIEHTIEKSFIDIEQYKKWLAKNQETLGRFGKKNKTLSQTIFHCSAKNLVDLYKNLRFSIQSEIKEESLFDNIIQNTSKFKTILTGNKLVRDLCAHPTLNWEATINKLTAFTFLDGKFKSPLSRIVKFYKIIQKHI